MDSVELIMKIEDRLDVRIPDDEASQIITVQDIYNTVTKQLDIRGRNEADLKDIINRIIADQAGLPLDEIQPYKSITGDLGLD